MTPAPWHAVRTAMDRVRTQERTRRRFREHAYLPAHLELVERPVSPTLRWTARCLLVGLVVVLLWLVFGRVDIVASARGRLVPVGDVKMIGVTAPGAIRRIAVEDGDRVRRGQILLELDDTVSAAERDEADAALRAAQWDVARNQAIANGLDGRPPDLVAPAGTSPLEDAQQRQIVITRLAAIRSQMAIQQAGLASAAADATSADVQLHTDRNTLQSFDREVAAMDQLAVKGFAPALKVAEMHRERRSNSGAAEVASAQLARAHAEARKYAIGLDEARDTARLQVLTDLVTARNAAAARLQEMLTARRRYSQQRVVAPVDGTIQQLSAHTIGEAVEPGRPLLVIVPDAAVVADVEIPNTDIGFVRAGQSVDVKFDAFPAARYGAMTGRLIRIGRDAVDDKQLGPVYPARIALSAPALRTGAQDWPLRSGMTLTAEIRTGRRSLLSYLVSPLEDIRKRSARER